MSHATAGKANKGALSHARKISSDSAALDRRYGQIGISAVAAAVRYQGAAKNIAYAPSPTVRRDRAEDAAA